MKNVRRGMWGGRRGLKTYVDASTPKHIYVNFIPRKACVTANLTKVARRDFDERVNAAKAAAEANGTEYEEPCRREFIGGGGSLAACGVQMSKGINRGAALVIEPELDNVTQWSTNETSVDSGAPAKLWDGRIWSRGVLEKTRAFTIPSPWLSILAAGHIPEVFKAMLHDKLGLRDRLTVAFPMPTWRTIAAIREACSRLPVPTHAPEDYLAALLYPCFKNSLQREGIPYTANVEDGAMATVDEKFDSHMSLQQDHFLKPHQQELAKKHGKLRTKFDRLVIAVHLLYTYCVALTAAKQQPPFDMQGRWGQNVRPAPTISKPVVQMAYLLCEYFEQVWDLLDFSRASHTLPPEMQEDLLSSQTGAPPPVVTPHNHLLRFLKSLCGRCWNSEDLDLFLAMDLATLLCALRSPEYADAGITKGLLLDTMKYALACSRRWFQYTSSSAVSRQLWRIMDGILKEKGLVMYVCCLAANLLVRLGLGALVRTKTVAGGGHPHWWFVGKAVDSEQHALLDLFDIHATSTPSVDALAAQNAMAVVKPTRATDVVWKEILEEDRDEVLRFLGLTLPLAGAPVEAGAPIAPGAPEELHVGAVGAAGHGGADGADAAAVDSAEELPHAMAADNFGT
jgi:hypothetical protein